MSSRPALRFLLQIAFAYSHLSVTCGSARMTSFRGTYSELLSGPPNFIAFMRYGGNRFGGKLLRLCRRGRAPFRLGVCRLDAGPFYVDRVQLLPSRAPE